MDMIGIAVRERERYECMNKGRRTCVSQSPGLTVLIVTVTSFFNRFARALVKNMLSTKSTSSLSVQIRSPIMLKNAHFDTWYLSFILAVFGSFNVARICFVSASSSFVTQ